MIDLIYNYTGYIHATFLLLVFSYVLWYHLLDRRLIQIVCPKGYIAALGAFFSLLLNVRYQVYPQVTFLIKYIITRVTFLAYYEACDTMGMHHTKRNEKRDL